MTGPLERIRVLDLTAMISGPSATVILADQGADVIKVENPKFGDHTRLVSTQRGGFSASFLNNNRNKRSIAIDLKKPEGLEVVKALAKSADICIQNFRPGVADRIGVGESAIRKVAPEIIYVSISGFGESGPYALKPVYDPLVQALSGLASVQAGSDEARPRLVRTILPDKLTGMAAAQAITAALVSRFRTGKGQHIHISMLDTVLAFLWGSDMGGHTFVGDELKTETAQSFIDLIYETTDGYISVAVQSDKEWAGLCRAFNRPEWRDDLRFATAALRQKNIDARLQLTQGMLKTDTASNWLGRLEAEDVPCAPVLTRRQVIDHPQIAANESIMINHHVSAGPLRQAKPAARFSQTPDAYRHPAPGLGENGREILQEAGISDAQIQKWKELGAISLDQD